MRTIFSCQAKKVRNADPTRVSIQVKLLSCTWRVRFSETSAKQKELQILRNQKNCTFTAQADLCIVADQAAGPQPIDMEVS